MNVTLQEHKNTDTHRLPVAVATSLLASKDGNTDTYTHTNHTEEETMRMVMRQDVV